MTGFSNDDVFCSDSDFAVMSSLAGPKTREESTAAMQEMEQQVQALIGAEDYGDEHRISIILLLQTRNFFARLSDCKQIGLPNGFNRGMAPEAIPADPLADKHVAIVAPEKVGTAVVHVLTEVPLAGEVRMQSYSSTRSLLEAIEKNQVAGILAIHSGNWSMVGSLRHDYKNLPGKTREDAQQIIFPPCIDVGLVTPLIEIATTVRQLSKGEPIESSNFDLVSSLPHLLVHAVVPENPVKILVIDDNSQYIDSMRKILQSWRNLKVDVVAHQEGLPEVPTADIVLLDEQLSNGITGQMVHSNWLQYDFKGIVASTTGHHTKPTHVRHHFSGKATIASKYQSAMEFVKFMNSLLSNG